MIAPARATALAVRAKDPIANHEISPEVTSVAFGLTREPPTDQGPY
jgi:hypothetical protein